MPNGGAHGAARVGDQDAPSGERGPRGVNVGTVDDGIGCRLFE
jgi:hypothetical protein